jgi:hypothetical protein
VGVGVAFGVGVAATTGVGVGLSAPIGDGADNPDVVPASALASARICIESGASGRNGSAL